MTSKEILIVDDEEVVQDVLKSLLEKNGYRTTGVYSAEEALKVLDDRDWDLILLDLMLPGMSGLDALAEMTKKAPNRPVIMITAFGTIESAVKAMQLGAYHYVTKPFQNEEVLLLIGKAIEQRKLKREVRSLKRALVERHRFEELIGKSKKMLEVYRLIEQVAPSRSTILIEGESGTGKELVAKAIHEKSPRSSSAFVVVNSMNIPSELLESNLFGHMKGAFTGATSDKKGLFDVADKGSIFFDEISTIKPEVQSKLLRVIQEKEFLPLGSVEPIKVNVRIIAATNTDLKKLVEKGDFREDLFYRINVITLILPPLRDRKDDIPLLITHFLDKYSTENGKNVRGVSMPVMETLMDYDWPGNVRELENFIERAVVLTEGEEIREDLLTKEIVQSSRVKAAPLPPSSIPPEMTFSKAVEGYERQMIEDALRRSGGVQKKAAKLLGIKPTTLNEKIKKLGIKT